MSEYWKTQPEELGQTQADRIAKSLKFSGMSHGEMAEFLECHRNTVGGWCTGKARMMPAIMRMWAQKTGVPYEWLRDGVWPEETPAAQSAPVKAQARKTTAPAKKAAPPARKTAAKKTAARTPAKR